MQIELSPSRRDDTLALEKQGDTLIVNGEPFDFSELGEGETLPRDAIGSGWFAGDVSRISGELKLTILLPNGPSASEAERFPEPITVTEDGPIALPGDSA